jgi:DNA helicase-2/ATP-dependent DNA helicase PcrA
MDFLDTLNPEQREAVLHLSGPLLILAGAGSGKTRVITSRIAYLVGERHAQANEILAVTFTNKAAGEMRARVEALIGSDCSRMWVSTFHSLCARLLRREAPAIGLSRDFVIYDSSDQLTVVKQALKALQIDDSFVQPRAALSRISHAKNRMESPDQMADSAVAEGWNRRDEQIAKVYTRYVAALKDANALDFDDLLLKTVDLFEQSERVRSRYAEQFRFVMVDEYQDTNRPQYLLIRRLAEVHRNLCVVGDPDQSISAMRGADLRNIGLRAGLCEACIVKLERTGPVDADHPDAASAVINQNRNRKDKHLGPIARAAIGSSLAAAMSREADFITRTPAARCRRWKAWSRVTDQRPPQR